MGGFFKAILSPVTSIVSAIFGGGEEEAPAPPPPPPPPAPTPVPEAPKKSDAEIAAAEREARLKVASRQGKTSNLATAGGWSGLGESTDEEDSKGKTVRRTLLG